MEDGKMQYQELSAGLKEDFKYIQSLIIKGV